LLWDIKKWVVSLGKVKIISRVCANQLRVDLQKKNTFMGFVRLIFGVI